MPKVSWRTFAIGARQFVVHEALRDELVLGLEDVVVDAEHDHRVDLTSFGGTVRRTLVAHPR